MMWMSSRNEFNALDWTTIEELLAVTLSFFHHCESRSWLWTGSSSRSPPCCCCCWTRPCCCWRPSGRGCCAARPLLEGRRRRLQWCGQRYCRFVSQFLESLGARDHPTLTCNGSLFIVDHWITVDLRLSCQARAQLSLLSNQFKSNKSLTFTFQHITNRPLTKINLDIWRSRWINNE